jgi:gamma-glutamylcyclotransferase (GGCT)/AIG2-like uncharacterized protein YtfP
LFVYGTLRKGFGHPLAKLLERSGEFFTRGWCRGLLYDVGPYPVLTTTTARDKSVFGDVFLLHEEQELLTILDEYEAVGEFLETGITYDRLKVNIESLSGVNISAWVYLYQGTLAHLQPIESGDYIDYIKSK